MTFKFDNNPYNGYNMWHYDMIVFLKLTFW